MIKTFLIILAALFTQTLIEKKLPIWYKKISGNVKTWWKRFKNRKSIKEAEELAEKIKEQMNL